MGNVNILGVDEERRCACVCSCVQACLLYIEVMCTDDMYASLSSHAKETNPHPEYKMYWSPTLYVHLPIFKPINHYLSILPLSITNNRP